MRVNLIRVTLFGEGAFDLLKQGKGDIVVTDSFLAYTPSMPYENHYPFEEGGLYLMTRHPVKQGQPWENVVTPFNPLLWWACLISVIIMSFCFFSLHNFYRKTLHLSKLAMQRKGPILQADFFLLTLASFTEPNSFPWFSKDARAAKVLVTNWALACLFISMAYQSNLRASLLRPKLEAPVNTLDDMLERR